MKSWAEAKKLLPRGFPRSKILGMNPAEIDNRDLEIDPLDQFGTMGPTGISVDLATYRLKVTGEVDRPLSLTYDEILKLPSVTENVLLICPGFFSNHGRWTGVHLKDLLEGAQLKKEAMFLDIKGHKKEMRIRLENIYRKKIFLAYRVNGEPLPKRHGFPLRLVYEDIFGDDWIKYVDEIVVAPMPKPGS
jgi:DMSO/TMAO reductase YedYZ molybdopterin-dependent catalytic subunit